MSWSTEVIQPPVDEPVTLAEAKAHLRVETDAEDELLSGYISGARAMVEAWCERAIMAQVRALYLPAFPGEIRLPGGFVTSIEAISYRNASGESVAMTSDGFEAELRVQPARVFPPSAGWPATAAPRAGVVTVTYSCGWLEAEDVPPDLRQAILRLVAAWYAQREAGDEMPPSVAALLGPYRVVGL